MNRREFLKKSAAAGAGFAVTSTLGFSANRALAAGNSQTGQNSSPDTGFSCKLGAYALPRPGMKATEALAILERMVGRRFSIHRDYQGMDVDIVSDQLIWLGNRGTIPYRSFHASYNHKAGIIRWADIAAGRHDDWLRRQANAIGQWGKPIYLSFHHEPEVWPQCGTPADYRAAWNHVRTVFQGVRNATWVCTLMSPTFYGNNGGPAAWLPYGANYDVLGVDGYNRFPCRGNAYTSFTYKFLPARNYSLYHGKALFIGEAGCVELNSCGHSGDPYGKARWIYEMQRQIHNWPRVIAMCWSHVSSGPYGFWVNTSSASMTAFRAVARDPYFT